MIAKLLGLSREFLLDFLNLGNKILKKLGEKCFIKKIKIGLTHSLKTISFLLIISETLRNHEFVGVNLVFGEESC